jgi:hypothetical protein
MWRILCFFGLHSWAYDAGSMTRSCEVCHRVQRRHYMLGWVNL